MDTIYKPYFLNFYFRNDYLLHHIYIYITINCVSAGKAFGSELVDSYDPEEQRDAGIWVVKSITRRRDLVKKNIEWID